MKIKSIIKLTRLLAIIVALLVTGCYKEEDVTPVFHSLEFQQPNVDGDLVAVSSAKVGEKVYFYLEADADLATIWPGEREIAKNTDGSDKLDFDTGLPIFVYSNDYDDYGIFGARGLKFQIQPDNTWLANYTFKQAGEHNIKLILTNHGYDGPDYHNVYIDLTFQVNP